MRVIHTNNWVYRQSPRQKQLGVNRDGTVEVLMEATERVIYKFQSYEEWKEWDVNGPKVLETK